MGLERPPTLPPEMDFVEKDLEKAPTFDVSLEDLTTEARERDSALAAKGTEGFYVEIAEDLTTQVDRYLGIVLRYERLRVMRLHAETADDERRLFERVDEDRRVIHNALIDNLNILTRHLGGEHATWYKSSFGNSNRDRIKLWALRQGFDRWRNKEQAAHE